MNTEYNNYKSHANDKWNGFDLKSQPIYFGDLCMVVGILTEKKARELLEKTPDFQRNRARFQIAKYATSMVDGKWLFLGDPIRISKNGNLCDGQHRVSAMIRADYYPPTLIIQGFDNSVEGYAGMDGGKGRSNTDWFKSFGIPNPGLAAATSSFLWRSAGRKDGTLRANVVPFHELYSIYQANLEMIQESIKKTRHLSVFCGSASILCATYVLTAFEFGKDKADQFVREIGSGIGHQAVCNVRKTIEEDNNKRFKVLCRTQRFTLFLHSAFSMAKNDTRKFIRSTTPIHNYNLPRGI